MAVSVSVKRTSIVLVMGAAMAAAGMILGPALSHAQDAPAAGAVQRPQPDMQKMNQAFGPLRRQISDASKNESSETMLAQMEAASISAKNDLPPTIAALPEADRPAKLVAYKKEMIKLIRQELDAEEALLSGDNAKAGEVVTAMAATEQEGHGEFRGRGGRRGGGGAPGAGGAPGGGAQ